MAYFDGLQPMQLKKSFLINKLCLESTYDAERFRIVNTAAMNLYESNAETRQITSPQDIHSFFYNAKVTVPDKVMRPAGDTTYFTSSGIQHIETLLRKKQRLEKSLFAIAQPVVRSQFLDKVRSGISTSFVSYTLGSIKTTPEEFVELSINFIRFVASLTKDISKITIEIKESYGLWGEKKFSNLYLTIFYDFVEVGECVYIFNFPVRENSQVAIADICFGVERMSWALGLSKFYMPNFDEYYHYIGDDNLVTSIIDPIRTATLLAGEGLLPSHKDPGYRLRQFMKRYLIRAQGMNIDMEDLVRRSYKYWMDWGEHFILSEREIIDILKQDYERNFNFLFVETLRNNGGPIIRTNINQPTLDFLSQIKHIPDDLVASTLKKLRTKS